MKRIWLFVFGICTLAISLGAVLMQNPLPSTTADFFQPGTQPNTLFDPLSGADDLCVACHGGYSAAHAPYDNWRASIKAQSARDPLLHAALAIAEQDAASSGETCLRCHAPKAWLEGRSTPSSGADLTGNDFEGVTCHVCHRMIDPHYDAEMNPPDDEEELAAIGTLPSPLQNGQYLIDRFDRRRGPFDLNEPFFFHEWRKSPFHQESLLCATCHDVSNPLFERVGGAVPAVNDSYVLGVFDAPHSTQNGYDKFPIERTYSEWLKSSFADAAIDMEGRFGGNKREVSTCQDCHMPDVSGNGCNPFLNPVYREDLPKHSFTGAGNWVLDAVINLDQTGELHPNYQPSGLTQGEVDAAKARNLAMLQAASDLQVFVEGKKLRLRVINQTGHKLPTGYPEGRRMWLNVRFFDAIGRVIEERGAYDWNRAALETETTKVYEAKLGLDAAMSQQTGIPAGHSFHFVLNNRWIKDNRIPPRGFNNAEFASVQAAPVGYHYANGQYWDDTIFFIPCRAMRAEVRVYYQTSSREYIEFLRDRNTTNNTGQIAYEQWLATGKSAPLLLDEVEVLFSDCNDNNYLDICEIKFGLSGDSNHNGILDECE